MNGNGYHTKLLSKTNNVTMAQVLGMDATDCCNVSVINAENNQYHQECFQSQQLAMSQPSSSHIQAAAPNTTMMMIIDPRICRDYVRGVCKRGFSCKFVHQTVVTSDVAASFNFPLPSDNGMGSSSKNFPGLDHQQQQYHLGACSSNSSNICRDYQNGICTRGTSCKYQHINLDTSQQHPHHQSSLNMDGTSTIVEDSTVMMSGGAGVVGGNTGSSTTTTDIDVGRRGGVVHEKSIPICRDYMKGKCERGFRCRFRHITMADYQQASLQLTVSGGPTGETNTNGPTAAPTKYVKNQQQPQHAYEYSSHGGEKEVTYSPIAASVVKSVIGCNGVSVSGDTASGSLLITRHAPPNQSATIQYSLPISVQSGHLTYVPASATINIVEPLIEPPLTKRRLCQISSSAAAMATFTNSSLFPTMHDDGSERNTINVITTMRETLSTNNNNKTGLANTAPSVNIITADASNMNFLIAAAAAVSASATGKESTEDSKSLNASSSNNVRDTTSCRTLKGSQHRMHSMFSVNTADTKDSEDKNGYNQSSTPITHTERALIEENESLKQRLDTLKKQITELNATVDMLLEQNKRLRMCGMVGISTTTCNGNINTNNSTSHNISLSSFSGGGAAQFAMATIASVAPSPLATPTPLPPYGHPQLQHHTNAATPLALFTPSVHPTLPLSVPLLTQSATAFMVAASSHPSPFVPTPLSSSTLPVSGATLTMVPCCVTPHHLSFPSHAFHGQQGPPQPQQPHHYVATWPILSSPSSSNNTTMANSPPTSTTTPTTVSIHSTIPNSYVASRDSQDNDSYAKTNSTINISYNSNNIKLSKTHANSTLDCMHERKNVTAVSALSSNNRITNNDSHKNQTQSDSLPITTCDINRHDINNNKNNLSQYLPANVAITVSSDVTGISNSAYINATESMAQDMKTTSASISRGKTTTAQSQSIDIMSNVLDSVQTFAQHTNSMNSNINNWNNTMDSSIGTNKISRSPIDIPVPSPE